MKTLQDLPPLTDAGNAERLAAAYGTELAYCEDRGQWRVWASPCWRSDTLRPLYRCALAVARAMGEEAQDLDDTPQIDPHTGKRGKSERARLQAHAAQSESKRSQEAMIALAAHMEPISRSARDFDRHGYELNTPGGIYRLSEDGAEVMANTPDRMHSRATRVAPNPWAVDTPVWDGFLDTITCGDAELKAWLHRAVGMSLIGKQQEHVFLFCSGDGGNGKGTFLNFLVWLLGDYGQTLPPNMLVERKQEAHLTELADLEGCRLVIGTEVPRGSAWDEVKIKMLTGGDRIRARKMRQDLYEFDATHTFWISGNDKPRLRGTDNGIWRRMRVVPFRASIPEAEQDRDLDAKLQAEAAGILRWAIEGCRLYRLQGLGWCQAVREATDAYRKEEDILGAFLEEECEVGVNVSCTKDQFRNALRVWLEAREFRPMSDRALKPELTRKGIWERRESAHGAWLWMGVRVRPAFSAAKVSYGEH